jgi:hypothetical protein
MNITEGVATIATAVVIAESILSHGENSHPHKHIPPPINFSQRIVNVYQIGVNPYSHKGSYYIGFQTQGIIVECGK